MRQNVSFFFYLMKVVALCGCGCILCVRACVVGASVLSILLYYVQGQYLVGNMVDSVFRSLCSEGSTECQIIGTQCQTGGARPEQRR